MSEDYQGWEQREYDRARQAQRDREEARLCHSAELNRAIRENKTDRADYIAGLPPRGEPATDAEATPLSLRERYDLHQAVLDRRLALSPFFPGAWTSRWQVALAALPTDAPEQARANLLAIWNEMAPAIDEYRPAVDVWNLSADSLMRYQEEIETIALHVREIDVVLAEVAQLRARLL